MHRHLFFDASGLYEVTNTCIYLKVYVYGDLQLSAGLKLLCFCAGTVFAYGVTSSGKTHTMHVSLVSRYYIYSMQFSFLSRDFLYLVDTGSIS